MDLSGKTIRVYEDCPKCGGRGYLNSPCDMDTDEPCPRCWPMGTIITHVKLEELDRAMQEIAKAAVRQVLEEREKKA